ncbi:BtrH N-terminal domain-containing protein [Alkalihalophilus marmarensis]|uniref:BtrH N-terminal domain-containing protein n=1 Tax=Alkalihalophilus marmarensis TaxID=521377 RepID=UPI002DB6D39A|nr:BtrH N-terminal domain-containing protein [Alkalihalophilus marmarensis]MEC2074267.1 BtrH N-terminal domain-containing protein [Alkalihalophilus marmarensis]
MIQISPREIPGRNCLQMSIENLLFYQGYTSPIYKQLSLTYAYDSQQLGRFYSGFYSIEAELKWINNINVTIQNTPDYDIFLYEITELLKSNTPVIIFVNPFYLKYSTNYQRRHVPHTITITGYEDDKFFIVDDVQIFRGSISSIEIIEAVKNAKYKYKYIYFPEEQTYNTIGCREVFEVIKQNTFSLKGEANIENSDISSKLQQINGIDSLEKFKSDLDSFLENIYLNDKKDEILDEIYRSIYGVSNQHFLYAEFLNTNKHLIPYDITEAIDSLNDLTQEWKIIAIMFMKSKYRKNDRLKISIQRKIDEIKLLTNIFLDKSVRIYNML